MSIRPSGCPAKRVPGNAPIAWLERDKASRAVRDYLGALGRENAEAPAAGRKRKPRMAISLTDPEAAWVAKRFGIKPQPARPACGRLLSIGPLRSRYFKTLLNSGRKSLML